MSSGLKVKAVSNMYTDSDLWGVWLCVGCLASIAEGDFYVFNGPCCRFPDFTSDPRNLKKGMNSIDEQGEIHTVRRCAGCLLAGKACIAPPDELFDELQAIQEQLKIIYDSSASALHSDAKGLVRDLAKDLTKTLERAPWTPHAVVLRLHNGETSADESPRSSVRSTASSKSKAAVKARDQAEDTHVSNLAAERLQNLQGSPGGRGNKRKYDNVEVLKDLKKCREEENAAKNALRDHMAVVKPTAKKAGENWEKKKTKLSNALEKARSAVQALEALNA